MLGLGALAVAGAWWLVRRMRAMRIVTAVTAVTAVLAVTAVTAVTAALAVLVLPASGAVLYRVGPMLHC
ncbi:hypothetical protein OG342_15915 [Streptomyces bobili]|uniref:hypothetical protein n=1 Tax=Streptomyces bobili TaxID=67280 RepID=UPI002252534B|nr:hypothetical protein [Streptomyces bobili]MCX5524339.1 hypothetical protein [Streptomyces bobili]